ncbi:DNA polymerase III subunit delta' [Clostridia bacterium]|nr:DNA polymerase III subunit delta' [Clostridia bacterium]
MSGAFHAVIIEGGTREARAGAATTLFQSHFVRDEAASRKLAEGTFEDLVTVEPEEGKAAIVVKQIEDLTQAFSRKPFASIAKAAIIIDGERMNESAQNKLLKLLEEPPEGYVIAILTANSEGLLPTVRSRCVRKWLGYEETERAGVNEDAKQLARILIYGKGTLAEANLLLGKYEESREEALAFLHTFKLFLRDLAVGRFASELVYSEKMAETAARISEEYAALIQSGVRLAEKAARETLTGYRVKYVLRGMALSMSENRRN